MSDDDDKLDIPEFLRRDPATDPAHLRRLAREAKQRGEITPRAGRVPRLWPRITDAEV